MVYTNEDLVDFALRQDRRMGYNLKVLLRFGVVAIVKQWEFTKLITHLQTNREFDIVTVFECNKNKGLIWLDSEPATLKGVYGKEK